MTKNLVSTISGKLSKVNETFTVSMYDNGYMFEIGGRDSDGDYKTAKLLCSTLAQLVELVQEAAITQRDE